MGRIPVKTVRANTRTMDYIRFGSGERAFVILPGMSIHSAMTLGDMVADAFSGYTEHYTVYMFSRANAMPDGYSVRDMAADTAAAMRALGIGEADVFGASQGGMIAQYMAIDHPELVRRMVLASTLSRPNPRFLAQMREWDRLAALHAEEELLASFADSVYSEATLKAYRETLIASNRGITAEEYRSFSVLAHACMTFDCSKELSGVRCPVLVIGAEGDGITTADGDREIAEALGCALYMYGTEYGHGVCDEAPDFRDRCLRFLLG